MVLSPGECRLGINTGAQTARFLPRHVIHKRGLYRHAVSVCLSVCRVRVFCRNE